MQGYWPVGKVRKRDLEISAILPTHGAETAVQILPDLGYDGDRHILVSGHQLTDRTVATPSVTGLETLLNRSTETR